MAKPERIKNNQLLLLISFMPDWEPVRKTIPQARIRTTIVRMAVARLELTFPMPIFAYIEVSAAKTAEPTA